MASNLASNQSWKLEDLQDLGLAEELQSGLYLSEFGSDSMKDIIDSLMVDDPNHSFQFQGTEIAPYPVTSQSSHTQCSVDTSINCVLLVPTACTARVDEFTITYLNRGQTYSMNLSCEKPTEYSLLKSSISLEFHDLRLRNSEETQIQQWMHDNNGQRMLEMVAVSCSGVSTIQHHEELINNASFVWASQQESVVSFKINALSSEFTAKKHGGEKGVPFRLVLNTSSIASIDDTRGTLISKCFCLVKVFKDKGADRKHKHDLQKREKLQPDEAAKYWESLPMTKLQPVPLSAKGSEQQLTLQTSFYSPTLQSSQSPSNSTPSNYSLPPAPEFNSPPCSSTSQPGLDIYQFQPLTPLANVEETRQWLTDNRFAPYVSLFANYGGTDLLRLSRKDLMDLCGPADGIRLYNAIHIRSVIVKRIYISLEEGAAYHAVFLEALTASNLKDCIARRLSIDPSLITVILLQHTSGILVNVDDLCVVNMYEEQFFQLRPIKDETGSMRIILKEPHTTDISMTGQHSRS